VTISTSIGGSGSEAVDWEGTRLSGSAPIGYA